MSFTVPVEVVVLAITGIFGFFTISIHGLWMIIAKLGDIRVQIAHLEAPRRRRTEESDDV